jgi:nitrate/nitrite transporter NarK
MQERELEDPLFSPLHDNSHANHHNPAPPITLASISAFPATFWLLSLLAFVLYPAVMSFNTICGDYLQDRFGYSVAAADRIMAVPFLVSAALFPVVGWAVDAVGRRPWWLCASALCIIAVCCVLLMFWFLRSAEALLSCLWLRRMLFLC